MKKKILEIWNEYKKDAKRMWYGLKRKWHFFIENLQDAVYDAVMKIKNTNNKKKYITIASILILLNILIINLFVSYSFYNDTASIPIVHTKVGDMANANYDYILQIFLENPTQTGTEKSYQLVNAIPSAGYQYSGYKCLRGSSLSYDEETKNTSINLTHKESCSIYFDLINSLDVKINVMLEDSINSDNYLLGKNIPVYGYRYDRFTCESGSELIYDSEKHSVSVSASGKDTCNMYFKKENSDIELRLFVENNVGTKDYIERDFIPSNGTYTLNTDTSFCENKLKERLDNVLEYTDGYIDVLATEISYCTVYLDKNA